MKRNNSSDNNIQAEKNKGAEENKDQDKELQKMNVNPNPRANENVNNTPFEKEMPESGAGSEITDGEAG